jgi:hypothetical protein
VANEWWIDIENATAFNGQACSTASFMDIKLGTSTLTKNGKSKGEAFIAYRNQKDEKTTSASLGYCVCGYLIKDSLGNKSDSGYKVHTLVTAKTVIPTIRKILLDD